MLTDALSLFSTNKAPALIGEVSCTSMEKGEVCEAFEIAAKECFANYGNRFEVAAVRSEEGRSTNYKIYILFDYPAFLEKTSDGWMVNRQVHSDLLEANKIVAGVIESRKGVPIIYRG